MVIPGWRYLVSGGTTGQVFTKVSSADGDYEWSTPSGGGGTPGGSDTQIQFNNAGVFGGVAGSAWSSSAFTFRSPSTGDQYCNVSFDNYSFVAGYVDIADSANNVSLYTEPGFGELSGGLGFRLIAGYSGTYAVLDLRYNGGSPKITANVDTEVTGDGTKGFILTDRTTTTRYRLFIDSGVLDIETV